MTSELLTDLLQSLALLGLFLLIGTFLRAKVRLFQHLFLPANVIGGFLLLLLGPQALNVLGRLGVPDSWFDTYNLLPGVLIVPIVAAVPLGLKAGRTDSSDSGFVKNVFPLFFIMLGAAMIQYAVGYLTQTCLKDSFDLYDVFGAELAIGFVGGHGTAGTLGSLLTELALPYASVSQGVATTTATIGIVGGVVLGIALINLAARKGYTAALADPSRIPESMRVGYEKDPSKQASTGRETTTASSIDAYAFHASLILLACGGAYLCVKYLKSVPVLGSFSAWAYGMIVMALIWALLCATKLDYLVDSKVKSHITGPLTDFAVIGAIASLPVKAVAGYIVPILIMSAVGIAATIAMLMLCKRLLRGCWFEQMIASFGMSTGVFITGILLLRIVDPESKTPALSTYSISYSVMSCVYFALMSFLIQLPISYGPLAGTAITVGLTALCLAGAFVSSRICFRSNRTEK